MPRWFSPSDALACAAAGVGAWFTRASLDAFAGADGEARVAMLPDLVEIPGLVVLACLCTFLLRSLLRRARGVPEAAGARQLLLPAVSLVALAVPYLPWLPDVVPAVRALAGPGRFALWALVFAQIAWCGADLGRLRAERRGAAPASPWPGVAVLAISAAFGGAVGVLLSRGGVDLARVASGVQWPVGLRLAFMAALSLAWWVWARRLAPSAGSAVATWLAIATAAPFLIGGLVRVDGHLAAASVTLVAAWPAGAADVRWWSAAIRGSALAALMLIVPAQVPLGIVLAAGLAWRWRRAPGALVAAAVPLAIGAAIAPFAHGEAWIVPHGSVASVARAAAALLIDQQEGLLLHAPALALAAPGIWLLWRDGGAARAAAVEAACGSAAALLAAAVISDGSRVVAIPGVPLLPVLPLLVAPLARWIGRAGRVTQIAVVRLLVSWGAIVTVLLPLARAGGVLSRTRDGTSVLLDWLAPSRDLVRIAPIVAPPASDTVAWAGSALLWLACALLLYRVAGRARAASAGAAAFIVMLGALAGGTLGAAAIDAAVGHRAPARLAPALDVRSRLLDEYDARRRPLAVAYDGWRTLPPADVPPLFSFESSPGARQRPQPLPVLLNTRLSLPAGEYTVTLRPSSDATLRGTAGLQVGRRGMPARLWTIAGTPGEPWRGRFTLPVDAPFVGVRTSPEIEAAVASLRVQPARVVNARDRWRLPPVVSAATYNDVFVTFHGDQVYAERAGFWVRGRATLLAAFAPPAARDREPGVRLSLHGGGAAPTRVRFETDTWTTTVVLEPGVSRELLVPAAQGQAVVPVRISPDNGFVPAQTGGGRDRRLLGCWIEVLD